MAVGALPHSPITANVVGEMHRALKKTPCFVAASDLRIRVSEDGLITCPDMSVVRGELLPGRTALDLMAHAFPPGSITGAPKLQAMKVIEAMEAPRGPFFGSMFWAGDDGALDSSVLIRTVAFTDEGAAWQFEARAGAGLVADSVPALERGETETKISAILTALRDDTD